MSVFGIDSLHACVPVYIEAYEIVLVFGNDSLRACVPVDIKASEIVPIGLALIVCVIVSLLTLKPVRSCPCLAMIVYVLVSLLTLMPLRSCPLVWH